MGWRDKAESDRVVVDGDDEDYNGNGDLLRAVPPPPSRPQCLSMIPNEDDIQISGDNRPLAFATTYRWIKCSG
jgi:hypothetical protein